MDATIDELLERYLVLVDEYTTLRASLAAAQRSVFQHLARANFTADRGVRYGPDQFDERMRASRRVAISHPSAAAAPVFSVLESGGIEEESSNGAKATEKDEKEEDDNGEGDNGEEKTETEKEEAKEKTAARNPIRWFGVLVPQALRDAQAESVRLVEGIVPRLVSVEAEMALIEIDVRRARKKRAKASGAAKKQDVTGTAKAVSTSS